MSIDAQSLTPAIPALGGNDGQGHPWLAATQQGWGRVEAEQQQRPKLRRWAKAAGLWDQAQRWLRKLYGPSADLALRPTAARGSSQKPQSAPIDNTA